MKRHLVFARDFDTRALLLEEPGHGWAEEPRRLHLENRVQLIATLKVELGLQNFDEKLQNFKDVGFSPFSIVSYHNALFRQARYSFIHGFYYPALVSAAALGERIINHLIIDLRDQYKSSPEYKTIYRKNSFDDWEKAISILEAWEVFQRADVAENFRQLSVLRNRSIHYNPETYSSLRADALFALDRLGAIISGQFGIVGGQRWVLPGTSGAFFIKKEFEGHPFIKKYYLPQCPLVGPYYAVRFVEAGILFFDRATYDNDEISDENFAQIFNTRSVESVVSSDVPVASGVRIVGRLSG